MQLKRAVTKRNSIQGNDNTPPSVTEEDISKADMLLEQARLRRQKKRAAVGQGLPSIPDSAITLSEPLPSLRTYLTRRRIHHRLTDMSLPFQSHSTVPTNNALTIDAHLCHRKKEHTLARPHKQWAFDMDDAFSGFFPFEIIERPTIVNNGNDDEVLSDWEDGGILRDTPNIWVDECIVVMVNEEVCEDLEAEGDGYIELPDYVHVWPKDTTWKGWWTTQGFHK